MARQYYFLSDLHFGGDGELQKCDFTEEFIAFLKELAGHDNDAELIIGGDMFGFWELTTVEGAAKFDEIVGHHQAIFDQLRETGARVTITVMAGNHDYDLVCDPEFAARLKAYNLYLDTAISLERAIAGRVIWIEHGQQSDSFNASPDYGNKYALPVGYFITRTVVAGASRFSAFGRGDWLKDIRSVGTEHIPEWILSNYFFREMNWAIRAVLSIFFILFSVTILSLGAEILRRAGIIDFNVFFDNRITRALGFVGSIFSAVVIVNMLIMFFMLAVAIPGFVVLHDIRRTLRRFQVTPASLKAIEGNADEPYLERAREVFASRPDAAVYLFGHTHDAFLIEENGKVIINMGTWLKILRRVPVRFGYLPAVFYPSFRLNFFHISADEAGSLVIRYVERDHAPARELTLLQRFLTIGRRPGSGRPIPATTTIAAAAGAEREGRAGA